LVCLDRREAKGKQYGFMEERFRGLGGESRVVDEGGEVF